MGWLGWLITVATALPPQGPSLAVLPLEAKTGVAATTADVLTENLVDRVRRGGAFSRVVSAREIETLLGFEKQKQLVNCTQESCVAELAGALGVDFLMTGSVARLGSSFVLNARLINVKTTLTVAAISHRFKSDSEEALLDGIEPAVNQLLSEGGLKKGGTAPAPAATTANAAAVAGEDSHGGGGRFKAAGGLALGGGVLLAVLAAGMVVAAVVLQVLPRVLVPPDLPLEYGARAALLYGSTGVVVALGALLGLLCAAAAAGGVALLVYGFTQG